MAAFILAVSTVSRLSALSRPAAIALAVAITLAFGTVGLGADLAFGTAGWWLALGSFGLCLGALNFANWSIQQPIDLAVHEVVEELPLADKEPRAAHANGETEEPQLARD